MVCVRVHTFLVLVCGSLVCFVTLFVGFSFLFRIVYLVLLC